MYVVEKVPKEKNVLYFLLNYLLWSYKFMNKHPTLPNYNALHYLNMTHFIKYL